jgi:hypothetical protein
MNTSNHDMMALPCQKARLLPEEMPVHEGIGIIPTVAGARKIAALMPIEQQAAFLKRAAEIQLLLAEDPISKGRPS